MLIWFSVSLDTSFLVLYPFFGLIVHGLILSYSINYRVDLTKISLSEEFLDEFQIEDDPFDWIIVYDFIDGKPNPNFWKNLEKMKSISSVKRVQYSVLIAKSEGEARAVAKLAEYYGADTLMYRCIEIC